MFVPDLKIQQLTEAYAQDAVDVAARSFGVSLDRADASIELLETVLGELHTGGPAVRPTEQHVSYFSKIFGSYLGEVFRWNHGATWGIVTLNRAECPGLRTDHGRQFWPWDRVRRRIVAGPDHDIWRYYLALVEGESETEDAPAMMPPFLGSDGQRLRGG
jgi:hypothetical protein